MNFLFRCRLCGETLSSSPEYYVCPGPPPEPASDEDRAPRIPRRYTPTPETLAYMTRAESLMRGIEATINDVSRCIGRPYVNTHQILRNMESLGMIERVFGSAPIRFRAVQLDGPR
jgi:hypothetical protein